MEINISSPQAFFGKNSTNMFRLPFTAYCTLFMYKLTIFALQRIIHIIQVFQNIINMVHICYDTNDFIYHNDKQNIFLYSLKQLNILCHNSIHSLWPSEAMWQYKSGSTLVQLWLFVWWQQAITWTIVNLWSEVFCGIHSIGNFTRSGHELNPWHVLRYYAFKITTYPRG